MKPTKVRVVELIGVAMLCTALSPVVLSADQKSKTKKDYWSVYKYLVQQKYKKKEARGPRVQLGPRPYYLVGKMEDGPLKRSLNKCSNDVPKKTDFSIGHRGATLQFPEHTKESFEAAARMGAGIIECDVTFTSDFELVCRHSQCDLHTTTNILATDLADKCTQGFEPATFDDEGNLVTSASAQCCTSDITYDEFKTLCGKMDDSNPRATTVDAYLQSQNPWRTDIYSSCGTLVSHAESIELIKSLGSKFTPELKSPSVEMPFTADDGTTYSQEDYAQKMIDEYKQAGVGPSKVWPQSFNLDDVLYWVNQTPAYGRQAVFLDNRFYTGLDANDLSTWEAPTPRDLREMGVRWYAPPMQNLLTDEEGYIAPNALAGAAQHAGLKIITWTIERSAPLTGAFGSPGFYYSSILGSVDQDGDLYEVLDVLAYDVGIEGIFTDWPATVTYYANCMGL